MVMHHLPPTGQRRQLSFDPEIGAGTAAGRAMRGISGPWHYGPVPAASNVVKFADGSTAVMGAASAWYSPMRRAMFLFYTGVEDPSRPDGRPDLSYALAAATAAL